MSRGVGRRGEGQDTQDRTRQIRKQQTRRSEYVTRKDVKERGFREEECALFCCSVPGWGKGGSRKGKGQFLVFLESRDVPGDRVGGRDGQGKARPGTWEAV